MLLNDCTVLDALLKKCRDAVMPEVTSSRDLPARLNAFNALLRQLPSQLGMRGDYVGPHIARKYMLGVAAAAGPNITFSKLSRAELRAMSPDMRGSLDKVPCVLTPCKLARAIQCPAEHITMWTCLWSEPLSKIPGTYEAVLNRTEDLRAELQRYSEQHGFPPSPMRLMERVLTPTG